MKGIIWIKINTNILEWIYSDLLDISKCIHENNIKTVLCAFKPFQTHPPCKPHELRGYKPTQI